MPPAQDTSNNLGELKGLLTGIQHMLSAQHEALNRRIDDMHHSNTRRLDDLSAAINQRITKQESDLGTVKIKADDAMTMVTALDVKVDALSHRAAKAGVLSGGGAGALVTAGIELAKALIRP